MAPNSIPIQRISPEEMRQRFNDGRYWERAKTGEFHMVVLEDRHPALPLADEPFCTQSQMVSYVDGSGNEIARVHQYLRTNKTIGLSGKPDPKRLMENGTLYRLPKNPKANQP